MDFLWVGVGGFVGANARYAMGRAIHDRVVTTFPLGTLTINVLGSIAIGFLVMLLAERYAPNHALRLLIVTGFLGGYTTFSSFPSKRFCWRTEGNSAALWSTSSVPMGWRWPDARPASRWCAGYARRRSGRRRSRPACRHRRHCLGRRRRADLDSDSPRRGARRALPAGPGRAQVPAGPRAPWCRCHLR